MKPTWYAITNAGDRPRSEVAIYGAIVDTKWDADDTSAKEFIEQIKGLGPIDLHINSPGGSVPAGNAIYNALRRHQPGVDVYIDGMALSMASVIAMAGQRVIMPANAMLMIHDPWSCASGNASELRKAADTLDKFRTGLVAAYCEKTGRDADEIMQLMAAETWLTAAEAIELGFADELAEPVLLAASFELPYASAPAELQAALKVAPEAAPAPLTVDDLRAQHAELIGAIEASVRQDQSAALAAATTGESERLLALVAATLGDEIHAKFKALAAARLTPEQISALGIQLTAAAAPMSADPAAAAMLQAITAAAGTGVLPTRAAAARAGIDTQSIYQARAQAMKRN